MFSLYSDLKKIALLFSEDFGGNEKNIDIIILSI